MRQEIRNFCIISHIDHGKSTLADRLLEFTNTVPREKMRPQFLDMMDLERERGITIRMQPVRMEYEREGKKYILNLIDTPGHVDFSYEVSRSIAACEGALLIVDATQGIQAQTISNLYLAIENDLEIIPVLNKMDLDNAMPDEVKDQIEDLIGCNRDDIIEASGKTGLGIDSILKEIIEKVPSPEGDENAPFQALIFDSVFNSFRGIIAHFRIFNGQIKKNDFVKFFNTGKEYHADEVGVFKLDLEKRDVLKAGDVGYIISGIKSSKEVKVGDTITHVERPCEESISGFEEVKPMVFAGIYPIDTDDYEDLRYAMEKLQLNDASLTYMAESSMALGFGFRCGFLGLLHLEVVQERLEREYDLSLILTAPTVQYKFIMTDGSEMIIDNPALYPEPASIEYAEEPFIRAAIIIPDRYMGAVMQLCIDRRGINKNYQYLTNNRLEMIFELPLAEVIYDFYDKLKSITQGYGSFDYDIIDYRKANLVKVDILINSERVDALSNIIHRDRAVERARVICEKLRDEIPKQMFKIPIQGAIGGKIIARKTISAFRKDVTAKCYGGDITRKRKLLEKQKAGKKRMKSIGKVQVPQEAFMAVLKLDS